MKVSTVVSVVSCVVKNVCETQNNQHQCIWLPGPRRA